MGLYKKSGISMSGVENTNNIKSIKCNCKKCFHCVRKNGMYYCKMYDLVNPHKKSCKRYSDKNDYSVTSEERKRIIEHNKRIFEAKRRAKKQEDQQNNK